MNDEVSVAELLVREGWGDGPGPGQSRWRVVAVMLAVIVGCGAAAALVAFGGKERQDASPVDQIQVIPFPQRTTGLGGADQATDSPPDGGIGGGTGGDVVTASNEHRGTVTEVPGRNPATETGSTGTAAPTATPSGAGPTTSSTATTTPPGVPPSTGGHPSAPSTPPPPPRTSCFLIICW
ncbi:MULTISPECIES: hypothetical protein [unclassified Amycolatopsis]|uniref:hypothetical protein n=1 Tax=unclassified Amycolatopsis TaxID=2618356 RepID=UPI0028746D55|nr:MULTISPECIES: hypothetical protein [unclassified Amycolatopsis]MDS0132695.1 hypothetical protein [Amycolatopsis sp. 505]MDS0142480.1 hypothetical protein [Amycolatopsis sp. CM201R]